MSETPEELRAALARAEAAVRRIEQADDYCYSNGVRDGYLSVVHDIRRRLREAEARG